MYKDYAQICTEAETERLSEENIHLRPKAEYTEQVLLSTNTLYVHPNK